jgi:type VI secretion system Hcp family effector
LAGPGLKHKVVLFRKLVDSTSPLFTAAMNTQEKLDAVTFRFVPTAHPTGVPPAIYFVRLSGASIASIKQVFFNSPSGMYMGWQLLEEITLYYQKIESGFNDKVQVSSFWPSAPTSLFGQRLERPPRPEPPPMPDAPEL